MISPKKTKSIGLLSLYCCLVQGECCAMFFWWIEWSLLHCFLFGCLWISSQHLRPTVHQHWENCDVEFVRVFIFNWIQSAQTCRSIIILPNWNGVNGQCGRRAFVAKYSDVHDRCVGQTLYIHICNQLRQLCILHTLIQSSTNYWLTDWFEEIQMQCTCMWVLISFF